MRAAAHCSGCTLRALAQKAFGLGRWVLLRYSPLFVSPAIGSATAPCTWGQNAVTEHDGVMRTAGPPRVATLLLLRRRSARLPADEASAEPAAAAPIMSEIRSANEGTSPFRFRIAGQVQAFEGKMSANYCGERKNNPRSKVNAFRRSQVSGATGLRAELPFVRSALYEAEGVGEFQRAGRHQGGILAQAVTRNEVGPDAVLIENPKGGN